MAGRARMATLTVEAVSDFMAELLKQYAAKQTFRPKVRLRAKMRMGVWMRLRTRMRLRARATHLS